MGYITKTFQSAWVEGWNGTVSNPHARADSTAVFTGDVVKDVRPAKPVPLGTTYMRITRTYRNGNYSYRQGNWVGNAWWCYTGWPGYTEFSDNRPQADSALQRAVSKFGQSELDLGQTLPMIRRSVGDMVRDLNKVTDLASKIALGNIPGVESNLGRSLSKAERRGLNDPAPVRLANNWLSYEYGWKQNIQDVYNSISELRKGLLHQGDIVRSASGPRSKPGRFYTSYGIPRNTPAETRHPPYSPTEIWGGDGKVRAPRASVRGVVSNPLIAELNRLGLVNPALIAWNLMPYSFVADWVLPISDILRSFSSGLGYQSLQCSVTTEYRNSTFLTANGVWLESTSVVERGSSVIAPFASANATLQKAVSPSWEKAANAAALLRQTFNRNR